MRTIHTGLLVRLWALLTLGACHEPTGVVTVVTDGPGQLYDVQRELFGWGLCDGMTPRHAITISRCRDWIVVSLVDPERTGSAESVCAFEYDPTDEARRVGIDLSGVSWCARFEGEGDVPLRATYYGDVDESCLGVPHRGGPATSCFLCGGYSAPCLPGMTLEASCDAP